MTSGEKPVAQIKVTNPYFDACEAKAEIYQMPDGEIYLGNGLAAQPLSNAELATLQKMLDRHARHFSVVAG